MDQRIGGIVFAAGRSLVIAAVVAGLMAVVVAVTGETLSPSRLMAASGKRWPLRVFKAGQVAVVLVMLFLVLRLGMRLLS